MKKRDKKNKISGPKKYKFQKKPAKLNFAEKRLSEADGIVIKGVLQGNSKGFAFLIPEDKEQKDIFIAPKNLMGALHADTVLVRILPKEGEQSDEGEVIEILQRGMQNIVGHYKSSGNFGFVIPDDARFFKDVFIIGKSSLKAKDNQKVVAKITLYPKDNKNPEGEIIEILGFSGEKNVELLSVIRAHNLYEEFEDDVLNFAKSIPNEVEEAEIEKRTDLRNITTITIDGFDAKDLDDAISIEKNADGSFKLGVHIADVTHYVKEGSLLDKEAIKRGTSVYFPDRVYPMLPRELSNGICSLNPQVNRLTLSVFIDIDKSGDILSHKIVKGVIKTTERMTYDSVTKILENDKEEVLKYNHILDSIYNFEKLAKILIKKRQKRGSIDLDLPEFKIIINDDGEIAEIIPYPRKISHRIIEEFMILANETVAEHITKLQLPFIYRIHEKPAMEKVEDFKKFILGFNLTLTGNSENMKSKDYANLIQKMENQPYFYIVNRVMLRTMMKAKYSSVNLGHFGLSSKCYCHFTSPIRRYPDLMIHRIIKYHLDGLLNQKKIDRLKKVVTDYAFLSSERERIAELAERDVDDYFKTKYMQKRIGQEFDGIISSVKDFGFFVELENTIEGLVRLTSLPADSYVYNDKQLTLTGNKHKFTIGDKVKIRVAGADMATRKIDFEICL